MPKTGVELLIGAVQCFEVKNPLPAPPRSFSTQPTDLSPLYACPKYSPDLPGKFRNVVKDNT